MNKKKAIKVLIQSMKITDDCGMDEILPRTGVFIQSKENIIADQEGWDEEDGSKDCDFTGSDYWITTDDGQDPIGFNFEEDAYEELENWFSDK